MPLIQHVYLGFYWLAMANSMINPCVYYWMNSRYEISILYVTLGFSYNENSFDKEFIHVFMIFSFYRFRSYIKALVSSVRLACCHPKSLLRRSYSRPSLDIGIIPFDQNILKVEVKTTQGEEKKTNSGHVGCEFDTEDEYTDSLIYI